MEPAATACGLKCHSPGAKGTCRAPGLSARSNLVPGRRGFDLEFVLRPMWCGECVIRKLVFVYTINMPRNSALVSL